ncbi:MAG: hypothetical protein KF893_08810 [Caldilineaceae bacterium]|nr:hypothetical protein [Caldilineaceae bacterium]
MSVIEYSLPYYEDVLEFLAGSPSAQEIIAFRPPQSAQERFSELLQANRERILSAQEEEEINHYIQIERMVSLLKAKAYSRLDKEEG